MKFAKSSLLIICLVIFSAFYIQMRPMTAFEKECTKSQFKVMILDSLFEGANQEFMSAGKCDHCHGLDANGIASINGEGVDVNLVDDWSSTMMANSAKDPFWRAKVSHEVFVNPDLQQEIERTCTRCHAPLGRFAAQMNGEDEYSIEDMLADSVALDGVSCLACHRQAPQPLVALHSGQLIFDENTIAFGQYSSPLISPMAEYTGYIPEQSDHIQDSKLCAACHSLVTETVNFEGNLTGDEFVEQATWHEWLNSIYPTQNTTCQTCHLPQLPGQNVILAAGYETPGRPDFALHTLAGGNTFMLGLMRDNRDALGIFAGESQFNETITATTDNLQNKSLTMEVTEINRTADTVYVDVKLSNITGHKMPSGYPARRMSVHLVATDGAGNEVFRSGGFDENFYVTEESLPFEPHHNIISSEQEVQIYEMVMGDILNERTTTLLHGFSHLKDNRLVPLGFTESSNVYDTTEVVLGIPDADFNFDPAEGSGTDIVHYRIPTNSFEEALTIGVEIYYQSIPPIWLDEIFTIDTPEISNFENMYESADKSPVLMKSALIDVDEYVGMREMNKENFIRLYRNLNGEYTVNAEASSKMEIYNISGQKLLEKKLSRGVSELPLLVATGGYLVLFTSDKGGTQIEKIIIE